MLRLPSEPPGSSRGRRWTHETAQKAVNHWPETSPGWYPSHVILCAGDPGTVQALLREETPASQGTDGCL